MTNNINYKNLIYGVIIILFIFLIVYLVFKSDIYKFSVYNTTEVSSNIDGENYRVSKVFDDKNKSADMMALLTDRVYDLLKILKRKYIGDLSGNNESYTIYPNDNARLKFIKMLLQNYRLNKVTEISPNNTEGDTSYVINKGEKFVVCLRDKKTHKIHNYDDLMFVVLHELTHMGTPDYYKDYTIMSESGVPYIVDYDKETDHTHGELFWILFKFLLSEAYNSNILKKINYHDNPISYCGLFVDYNPYFDTTLFDI